ncbi:hypothetical protein HPP92_002411 [Vanilla planifolia]|uniref:Uncharacterized protein n=1 Tax=Vanilla planifolia TaxID=51239 RepID=A0A835RSJ1_VANPL|nr:hypothetical protein HPP92_002411 [Vanilla planifolia]
MPRLHHHRPSYPIGNQCTTCTEQSCVAICSAELTHKKKLMTEPKLQIQTHVSLLLSLPSQSEAQLVAEQPQLRELPLAELPVHRCRQTLRAGCGFGETHVGFAEVRRGVERKPRKVGVGIVVPQTATGFRLQGCEGVYAVGVPRLGSILAVHVHVAAEGLSGGEAAFAEDTVVGTATVGTVGGVQFGVAVFHGVERER